LDSLTGLRAAAAAVVLASHLRWLISDQTLATVGPVRVNARIVMQQGNVGVSLFFLLSGFVLMWSWREDRSTRFWGRRVGRVYPLHLVMWTIWMVLVTVGLLAPPGAGPAITSLFLVQAWVPSSDYYIGVNPPTWSLSCEVFFYALFPAIAFGLSRMRQARVTVVAWVTGILAVGLPALFYALDRSSADVEGSGWTFYYLTYVFPPTRLVEFVLGSALALLVANGRLRRVSLPWAMLAALVAYLIAGRAPRIIANSAITLVPFVFLLVAAAGADLTGRRSLWRHPFMRHLGEVSFAVFIVQYPVIELLRPGGAKRQTGYPSLLHGIGVALLATALIMIIAEGLHFGVERPAERWFRHRFSRPDDAELATAAE